MVSLRSRFNPEKHCNTFLTRTPSSDLAKGITDGVLGTPDYALALEQHTKYRQAGVATGARDHCLGASFGYPDSVFAEDVAVILPKPGTAMITRPGVKERRL